jgi:hypothetical protein
LHWTRWWRSRRLRLHRNYIWWRSDRRGFDTLLSNRRWFHCRCAMIPTHFRFERRRKWHFSNWRIRNLGRRRSRSKHRRIWRRRFRMHGRNWSCRQRRLRPKWFDSPCRFGLHRFDNGLHLFYRLIFSKELRFLLHQHRRWLRRRIRKGDNIRFRWGCLNLLLLFFLWLPRRSHRAGEVIGKTVGFARDERHGLPDARITLLTISISFVNPKLAGRELNCWFEATLQK